MINGRGEQRERESERDAKTEGMMEHHVCTYVCVKHRLLYDVCLAKQMVAESENREREERNGGGGKEGGL